MWSDVAGADLLAALVANCLRGALPPVDLQAVCFVRAILEICTEEEKKEIEAHVNDLFKAGDEVIHNLSTCVL